MVDVIDELKRKYTGKYVVVDGSRPELARFRDTYGTVKTVNMSGRALVEFANYHLNIGWYDIDTAFLKVVDTPPEPKVKEVPAKGEPASAGGSAPAKLAAKPSAKPAAGGAKQSTSDILAALRAGGAKAPAAKGEPASAGGSAPAKPAPAPKASGAAPAKVDRSKMSVADMLAAARAGGAKPTGEPASAGGSAGVAQPEPPEAPTEEPVVEAAAPAPPSEAPATKVPSGPIDKKSMTIDQMIAWCREHDTK